MGLTAAELLPIYEEALVKLASGKAIAESMIAGRKIVYRQADRKFLELSISRAKYEIANGRPPPERRNRAFTITPL